MAPQDFTITGETQNCAKEEKRAKVSEYSFLKSKDEVLILSRFVKYS